MEKMALVLLIGTAALAMLPSSPFTYFIGALQEFPFLGVLNWFVPVPTLIAIGEAWLMAITVYYLLSIVLRWIKAVE